LRYDARIIAGAIGLQTAFLLGVTPAARALPPPAPPKGPPSASPQTPAPPGTTLPYGSIIYFVLDDGVNSGTTEPGTTIHMHLKSPIVVNGVTVAPAGAPATFAVITTLKANTGDEDGAIEIHLDPLKLPGRDMVLPVRALHEYLTRELTAGQEATRSTTDTLGDIFIPYHVLYHALRPGHQMVLPVGSVLRAETAATIDASDPHAIVLATPPPFSSPYAGPHADLTAPPFYTPAPMRPHPLPRGKPTLPPKPAPTPSPAAPAAGSTGAPDAAASPATAASSAASPSAASPSAASPSAAPPAVAPPAAAPPSGTSPSATSPAAAPSAAASPGPSAS